MREQITPNFNFEGSNSKIAKTYYSKKNVYVFLFHSVVFAKCSFASVQYLKLLRLNGLLSLDAETSSSTIGPFLQDYVLVKDWHAFALQSKHK